MKGIVSQSALKMQYEPQIRREIRDCSKIMTQMQSQIQPVIGAEALIPASSPVLAKHVDSDSELSTQKKHNREPQGFSGGTSIEEPAYQHRRH